jgi:NTP pyrophosphatase (non-canonical NTP hydrolase)
MNIEEYRIWTRTTAKYPKNPVEFQPSFPYLVMGLSGEAGEVANKYKKIIRDKSGIMDKEDEDQLLDELGDVMWYIARIVDELGSNFESLADKNYQKLQSRLERGVIGGSGDNR